MNQQSPYANPYAAPQAGFGAPPAGFAQAGGGISAHVEGAILVAANGSSFPAMCLKCGAAPTHWRAQRYSYTPPWAFFVLGWLGVLIFTKRSSFQVPLCEPHRAVWKKWSIIAGVSWIPGLLLLLSAGALGEDAGPIVVLLGLVLLLGALITSLALRARRGVYPSKIDKTHTWLRGVDITVLQAISNPGLQAQAAYAAPAGYGAPPAGYAAPGGGYGPPQGGYGPPPNGYPR
jgi:hypothetical protein